MYNLKIKALLATQHKKEDLQRELENLLDSMKSSHIIHKQQVKDVHKTNPKLREDSEKSKKHDQEQIRTLQGRVRELEDNIMAYQRKDDEYVEALVMSAAYETWVTENRSAKEGIQQFQSKVADMTQDTIHVLHMEIERLLQEKEELQKNLEETAINLKTTNPGFIRELEQAITALQHFPPAISIKQNFEAIRGLTLLSNGLPNITPGSKLNQEEFIEHWERAWSVGRDTLMFMWALGELKITLGVLELATVNPGFYVARYCIWAMAQIADHHKAFYTTLKTKEELLVLHQYTPRELEKIHTMMKQNEEEFAKAKERFAAEDLSVFTEATKCHQWL